MGSKVTVHIAKGGGRSGVVQYRKRTVREWLLTRLLGETKRVMIIVPDDTVREITIQEAK